MIRLGEIIGSGNTGDVYAIEGKPGRVVKLITKKTHSVIKEFEISRIVGALGCGAPRAHGMVRIDGLDGIEYDRARGETWLEALTANPHDAPEMARRMAELHWRIHSFSPEGLEVRHEGPRPNVLCHGDFHPGNIMGMDDPVVIDWNDAYAGDPASDVCRTLLLLAGFGHSDAPQDASHPLRYAVFGFGALYLREYLRLSGMEASDVFRWQKPLALCRLDENIEGQERFLRRAVTSTRTFFPWDHKIKRKPLAWGLSWDDVVSAHYDEKRIECPSFSGWAGLMRVTEVARPITFDVLILDTNFRWLHLLPDAGDYAATAYIDPEGEITFWYIDIIDGKGASEDGVWFDDLFLDVGYFPDGRHIIDDRDELEAAFALGVITQEQYEKALRAADRLLSDELSDPMRMNALSAEILLRLM